MLVRAKILVFFVLFGVAVYNGVKFWRRTHPTAPPPSALVDNPVDKSVDNFVDKSVDKSVDNSPPPFVRCDSWGRRGAVWWGYGEGLYFEGVPNSWDSGQPVYKRLRGRQL